MSRRGFTSLVWPCAALMLGACATHEPARRYTEVAKPSAAQAAMLERIKSLEGTWEMTDEQGRRRTSNVFSVSSAGSAVREVMFPGGDHEMTNLYHMDGPTLVMTHYCAGGNQPRMRATSLKGNEIDFVFDGISNLHDAGTPYMAEMRLVLIDGDHIRQVWQSHKNGAPSGNPMVFELSRQR